MAKHRSRNASASIRVEGLESRALLTLIATNPTIDAIDGPGVRHNRFGGITILQPASYARQMWVDREWSRDVS